MNGQRDRIRIIIIAGLVTGVIGLTVMWWPVIKAELELLEPASPNYHNERE
ncbi:MAG: hypothetical protein H7A35_01335 [Planctomycetales bacterium]|nr:hypothetical protein [bacterium]UNM08703.1 MAG: hypothetical protein H7A35_01335 [Planctomycetales bacterium]